MKQSTKYLKIFCNLLTALLLLLFIVFVLPGLFVYFMPFLFGFVLSLIANPVVRFLERKIKIKRKYGSMLIIILVIGALILLCYGLFAAIETGLLSFSDYFPTMYKNALAEMTRAGDQLQNILDHIPFMKGIDLDAIGEKIRQSATELVSGVGEPTVFAIGGFAKRIPNALVSTIVGLMATYFFIAEKEKVSAMIDRNLPESFRVHMRRIHGQLVNVVGGYFKAQFKIMGVIYVVVTIGLMILDVNYAWLIGFGIAFLDMLPVFGAGTVLCPWAIIKFFSGNYATAFGMLILYAVALVVHQIVQPKLIGDSVGMDSFAALFFMYVGYRISSVLGMILAIPIGMILINLYKAGAFDTLVWCVREVVKDFNEFRRIPKD
ncbi:MAG: sporulation integral membrane protein YtvI [Roseburia sp.]